jgi:hypothetical protein
MSKPMPPQLPKKVSNLKLFRLRSSLANTPIQAPSMFLNKLSTHSTSQRVPLPATMVGCFAVFPFFAIWPRQDFALANSSKESKHHERCSWLDVGVA